MPFPRLQHSQCIFCAFSAQSQSLTKHTGKAATSNGFAPRFFATTSGLRRSAATSSGYKSHEREYNVAPDAINDRSWPGSRRLRLERSADRSSQLTQSRDRRTPSRDHKNLRIPHGSLKSIVLDRLDRLERDLRASPVFKQPGLSDKDIDEALGGFRRHVRSELSLSMSAIRPDHLKSLDEEEPLGRKLSRSFLEGGDPGLDQAIKYALYNHFLGRNFSEADLENQRALADLRYPNEWHTNARNLPRVIHAHIGPTNSGKTYHALKRLETAAKGIYAGPLRLLAHEVYTRLVSKGLTCALITGEELRFPPGWQVEPGTPPPDQQIICATVEMTSLENEFDVAVIDEIQMLGNLHRGSAWTNALLGLRCREIHVCGEERALPIIRELAAVCGDKLVVHTYDRLTHLKMDERALGNSFEGLRKGDCIVTFSVMGIHGLKSEIEQKTGKKVAVVYGSLPPETRAQQARLFNDPNNEYDILVASDAVGMGLNLSIKRIIFETIHRFSDDALTKLTVSDIRQIAGRAGRYRTSLEDTQAALVDSPATTQEEAGIASVADCEKPRPDRRRRSYPEDQPDIASSTLSPRAPFDDKTIGLVTTIDKGDFVTVANALNTQPPPITYATIAPPPDIVARFSSYFPPGTPLSYILMRLTELGSTSRRYRISTKPQCAAIADAVHGLNLTLPDIMVLIMAPLSLRRSDDAERKLLRELAKCIVDQRGGELVSLKHVHLEILDEPIEGSKEILRRLEQLHKAIVLYLWLSFRFPGIFVQRPLANYVKGLVEQSIEECLRLMTFQPSDKRRMRIRKMRMETAKIMEAIRKEQAAVSEPAGVEREVIAGSLERQEEEPHVPQDDEGAYLADELNLEEDIASAKDEGAEHLAELDSDTSLVDVPGSVAPLHVAADDEPAHKATPETHAENSKTPQSPETTTSRPRDATAHTEPSPSLPALGQDLQSEPSSASTSIVKGAWKRLGGVLDRLRKRRGSEAETRR